jgi:hypothetical protein
MHKIENWLTINKLTIYFSGGTYKKTGYFTINRANKKQTELLHCPAFGEQATAVNILSCVIRESLYAEQSYEDLVKEGLFEEDSLKGYNNYQQMKKTAAVFNKILAKSKDLDGNKPTALETLIKYLEEDELL